MKDGGSGVAIPDMMEIARFRTFLSTLPAFAVALSFSGTNAPAGQSSSVKIRQA